MDETVKVAAAWAARLRRPTQTASFHPDPASLEGAAPSAPFARRGDHDVPALW